MSNQNGKMLSFVAFVALVAVALLEILGVLPITFDDVLNNIIITVKNVCICVVIAFSAYAFVANKGKGYKITYWVSVGVFLLSTVFIWIF